MTEKTKKEEGFLVVEASLALFFLVFFMLFIWNFSGVFAAQNAVSHAAMQSAQTIAVDNMSRAMFNSKNEEISNFLSNADSILKHFNDGKPVIGTNFSEFNKMDNKVGMFKDKFYYMLGGDDGEKVAESLGIDVKTIKFEVDENEAANGYIKAKVSYTVKLRFGVFGIDSMNLEKQACCRLFGYEDL